MRLDEYQWSRNPRGLHVASAFETPLPYDRYTNPHMGWAKLLAAGTEYVDDAQKLIELGITPIVRLYLGKGGARPFDSQLKVLVDSFALAGVKWFEFYNEPNLGVEWPDGIDPDWRNQDGIIRPLMDNWISWAEYVVSIGCYPGFIPLAESADYQRAAVFWMDAFLKYLAANQFERFRTVLANGAFCATHPYTLNHFYQEAPGGGARPPGSENAAEGGWHFEYPYDPINQANDPGRTVYGGTRLTPNGDPVGLTAMGRMFNERCSEMFGTQAVPVVGTEGGIYPFRGGAHQQDNRYPPYTEQSQGEATVAMFQWIAQQAQPWFFGVTLWKEDDYYVPTHAHAIDRLTDVAPILKNVPSIEVMGTGLPPPATVVVPGPGPIHGQADFHMIILAPGLEARWFFDTAQAYWNRFRPIVTTMPDLIDFIPSSRSLAATVISPPDMVDTMRHVIKVRYPNVWFDLIVADNVQNVADTLNYRARQNLRFG